MLRFLQDTTNSGAVTKAMMLDYASKKGITQYSKEQLKEYFDLLDKNNTGTLDKSEFSALFEVLQANADESEGLETDLASKDLTVDMLDHHTPALSKGSVKESFVIEESADNATFYAQFEADFDAATSAQKTQSTHVLYPDQVTGSFGFGVTARDSGKLIVNSVCANATKYGIDLYDVIVSINGGAVGNGEGMTNPEQACSMLKEMKGSAHYITLTWVTLDRGALTSDARASTEGVVDTYIASETSAGPTCAQEVVIELEVEKYCADMDIETGGTKLGMNISFNTGGDAGEYYAVVTEVFPDTMAANAGFKVHDIIKSVGTTAGTSISNIAAFNAACKAALGASTNTHIQVTVARLTTAQFAALQARGKHNPSFFVLSQATLFVILVKMLLFIPYLYASILFITYGALNTWTLLVTGAALVFLIEVDKIFYDKLVSGSEKAAMTKDLNAAVLEDDKIREEFEQVDKMTRISALFAQKAQPSMSSHEVTQFGKAIEAGSRNALNKLKTEYNADGSINRTKRISVHFPEKMSLGCFTPCSARDVLSFEATDQWKLCCLSETTSKAKQLAPENIFTYAAWKITEGQISWPLFIKVVMCLILQFGCVFEIIAQYKWPLNEDTCNEDNKPKGITLMLVVLAVFFCGMNDVYESMISVNLVCWPEHFKDYDGAMSACYEMIFPSTWSFCCNGCSCLTGGAWTLLVNIFVTISAALSSAPVAPFLIGFMYLGVWKATLDCDE